MHIWAHTGLPKQTARHPHILVAICTATMMMLSAHYSIVQLSWLPGYISKAADCFCEQHWVVTVQCFFVLTAATTFLSLFCCYCLKVQARQQRPLGRAQRQNCGWAYDRCPEKAKSGSLFRFKTIGARGLPEVWLHHQHEWWKRSRGAEGSPELERRFAKTYSKQLEG